MRPHDRSLPTALLLGLALALAALSPVRLAAQAGVGQQEEPGPWAPPSFGIRYGYDNQQRDDVLGAQVRIPILPHGEVELMPSVDITFLRGLKEYQYNIEAVYVLDGRAGGIYGGGGVGFRNTIFDESAGRSTEMGFTGVVGIRLVGLGLIVPQIEYRAVFIDKAPVTYQQLSIGVNLALWRPVRQR
jgi:hypothetical protein